jgi:hypothetical protein
VNYTHEELNSSRPYEYLVSQFEEEESYLFVTNSGVEYTCYFLNASAYFEDYPLIKDDIVTFGFRPLKPSSKGFFVDRHDPKIKETIVAILHKSVKKHPEGCIFIMFDAKDGRQRNRKIIFNTWYNDYCAQFPKQVTKLSISASGLDHSGQYDMIMLVPNTCQKLAAMKETFIEIRDELISKGYPPTLECRINCK